MKMSGTETYMENMKVIVHKKCANLYLKNRSTNFYEAYISRLLKENEKLLKQNAELRRKLKKQVRLCK